MIPIKEEEPSYIKLYFNQLSDLSKYSMLSTTILYAFIKRINKDNQLILKPEMKVQVKEELILLGNKVTINTINTAMERFVDAEIFIKKDKGVYLVNTKYMSR